MLDILSAGRTRSDPSPARPRPPPHATRCRLCCWLTPAGGRTCRTLSDAADSRGTLNCHRPGGERGIRADGVGKPAQTSAGNGLRQEGKCPRRCDADRRADPPYTRSAVETLDENAPLQVDPGARYANEDRERNHEQRMARVLHSTRVAVDADDADEHVHRHGQKDQAAERAKRSGLRRPSLHCFRNDCTEARFQDRPPRHGTGRPAGRQDGGRCF